MVFKFAIGYQNEEIIKRLIQINKENDVEGIFQISHGRITKFILFYLKPHDVKKNKVHYGENRKYVIINFKEIKFVGVETVKTRNVQK